MSKLLSGTALAKNSAFMAEYRAAKKKSDMEPKDRRRDMTTLQTFPWRTSAIQSDGSLLKWLFDHENANIAKSSSEEESTPSTVTHLLLKFVT